MPTIALPEMTQMVRQQEPFVASHSVYWREGGHVLSRLAETAYQDWGRHSVYIGMAKSLGARPPRLTDDEFFGLLDELASGPPLPRVNSNFSREEIYADDEP